MLFSLPANETLMLVDLNESLMPTLASGDDGATNVTVGFRYDFLNNSFIDIFVI